MFVDLYTWKKVSMKHGEHIHVFRKIEIIHVWHIESSVAQKRNLLDFSYSALSRQCFQMCAVKNSISPGYGLFEFLKLKNGAKSVP